MADACLPVLGVRPRRPGWRASTAPASAGGVLDGWLVHTGDTAELAGVAVLARALLMTSARGDRRDGRRRGGAGRPVSARAWRTARAAPDHRDGPAAPGQDLAAEILRCAPWLADDDILVVTSKVVSKVEGRLVSTSGDPAEREAARQQAIDDETVRVIARRGPLRIAETRHGLVMAAAGVDASNLAGGEIALLPLDPDGSARRLREAWPSAPGCGSR